MYTRVYHFILGFAEVFYANFIAPDENVPDENAPDENAPPKIPVNTSKKFRSVTSTPLKWPTTSQIMKSCLEDSYDPMSYDPPGPSSINNSNKESNSVDALISLSPSILDMCLGTVKTENSQMPLNVPRPPTNSSDSKTPKRKYPEM